MIVDKAIIDAISYANQFRETTVLIKLGGSVLHDDDLIKSLCADLRLLQGVGIKVVIVHGGSKAINKYLAINQIESHFVDGLRVTSPEAMEIIEMVLCGHVNKMLVRKLNHIGVKVIGMSGADNNMLQCDPYSQQHGCVGAIRNVNVNFVNQILAQSNSIPIIAPVGVDAKGNPMNINADYAASDLAVALKVDKLIYLTDQDGILDKKGGIYSELCETQLSELIRDETVKGGMLAKTKAILAALSHHLNHVHILNGSKKHVLLEELFTVNGVGTLCKKIKEEKDYV